MPYIPQRTSASTVFPRVNEEDFFTAMRLTKEKFQRLYPAVLYSPIASAPGLVTQIPTVPTGNASASTEYTNDVSAVPNQTIVDDLWGESIPQTLKTDPSDPTKTIGNSRDWVQPHSSTDSPLPDAADPRKFTGDFWINVFPNMSDFGLGLGEMGIDETREILVTVPTIILDEAIDVTKTVQGIRCQIGDKFAWNGSIFDVCQVRRKGYWKRTNVFFFLVLECQLYRFGS